MSERIGTGNGAGETLHEGGGVEQGKGRRTRGKVVAGGWVLLLFSCHSRAASSLQCNPWCVPGHSMLD